MGGVYWSVAGIGVGRLSPTVPKKFTDLAVDVALEILVDLEMVAAPWEDRKVVSEIEFLVDDTAGTKEVPAVMGGTVSLI